jgi:hypothetical protein
MTVKTKQTTEHEIQIPIPFFRKKVEGTFTEYLAMLSEDYVHGACNSKNTSYVEIRPKWVKEGDIVTAINEWEPIAETEFLSAYNNILSSLSLKPSLVNNPDDLKEVNI